MNQNGIDRHTELYFLDNMTDGLDPSYDSGTLELANNPIYSRLVDNRYLKFTLDSKDQKINIFFDKKTLNLVGWQTEDIYQNLVVTFIYDIKKNKSINKKYFQLPPIN